MSTTPPPPDVRTQGGIEIRRLGATGLDLETRASRSSSDLPHIVGYAAVFDSPTEIDGLFTRFTEIIRPGAFSRTIGQDDIRALFNHDHNLVLGRSVPGAQRSTLKLEEDRHGLRMDITPPDTQAGRDAVEMVKRGDVTGASFGFTTTPKGQRWTTDENGDPVQREILEAKLYDVSPVTFPAYDSTEVSSRALAWTRRALSDGLDDLTDEERLLIRRLLELSERRTSQRQQTTLVEQRAAVHEWLDTQRQQLEALEAELAASPPR